MMGVGASAGLLVRVLPALTSLSDDCDQGF